MKGSSTPETLRRYLGDALKPALRAGFTLRPAGGHYNLYSPAGTFVLQLPGSPRNYGDARKNTIKRLRQKGVPMDEQQKKAPEPAIDAAKVVADQIVAIVERDGVVTRAQFDEVLGDDLDPNEVKLHIGDRVQIRRGGHLWSAAYAELRAEQEREWTRQAEPDPEPEEGVTIGAGVIDMVGSVPGQPAETRTRLGCEVDDTAASLLAFVIEHADSVTATITIDHGKLTVAVQA